MIPATKLLPEDSQGLRPGHAGCPGCGHAIAMNLVLRSLGPRVAVVVVPSCAAVVSGPFPHTCLKVPAFHSAFEIAAPTAAGIAHALELQGDDRPVVAFAGDGGTFDIGLQSLSGAADRNENILYVCLDNEAYMNTGIQVSGSTPQFAWTGTTPSGNERRKKHIMEIMAAHRIPYAATASVGFAEDLIRKVQRAKETRGTRFIHLLSPCVTGWKIADHMAPKVAALAVETNVFPLYEIEDGVRYRLNFRPRPLPVEKYLSAQGRFRHLRAEQIAVVQAEADRTWAELERRAACAPVQTGFRG
ncbi:MAG: pyruvate synthase subunit beta [Deltaproteobacteria bacterium]|nr:pyruvate synthase subunit beta [Deltaproteobacteria bacterium]